MSNLVNIRVLTLRDNQISEVPAFCAHLTELKRLTLKQRKLKGLPDVEVQRDGVTPPGTAVLKLSTAAVNYFLASIFSNQIVHLLHHKFSRELIGPCIVGDAIRKEHDPPTPPAWTPREDDAGADRRRFFLVHINTLRESPFCE